MSSSPRYVADYYESLGVEHESSTEEIKKAFRKLARECHPDVAKDDPDAAARFSRLRQAYETLVDPVKRSRYDRSMKRAAEGGGPWRPPGGPFGFGGQKPERSGPGRPPASHLDLEDIFGDFGGMSDFGFGTPQTGRSAPRPAAESRDGSPGRDINMVVDVPSRVAEVGGTVTLHYPRLRRSDDGASQFRYNEIYDLRIAPGTNHGDVVRVERMGDAGGAGGPYGDLVADVRVVGGRVRVDAGTSNGEGDSARPGGPPDPWSDDRPPGRESLRGAPPPPRSAPPRSNVPPRSAVPPRPAPPPRAEAPRAEAPRAEAPRADDSRADDRAAIPADAELKSVAITVTEALLGGRVEVDTVGGRVRVTIPPCTSSGTRLRLRGKASAGRDLYVELRIVLPRSLDDESRRLIERFAELNPDIPRDST